MIKLENLKKSYGSLEALRGVTLNVEQGETFALLGPNGAGKTTVINILCTLLRASSGKASVNSIDCAKDAMGVRSSIGLVFQEVTLDNELTAYENLKFHCYLYNMDRHLTDERITEMLGVVGLVDKAEDFVKTFSGGMKRRLEIARGLLHRPKVLFLDEPTLGLDPQTRNRLWDYILDLRKRDGTTIFLTTHYMDEAENADRIAIIDHGKLVAVDTPGKLKKMVSKDIICVKTENNDDAAEEIKQHYRIDVRHDGEGITFEVDNGEEFLPPFIKEFSTRILSVSLRHPSLDDVFLKLTGREIREEESTGDIKAIVRQHGRRMRR